MLHGRKVRLRAIERSDIALLHQFNNDLAVELSGGGDPPMPQSLARLQAEYDQQAARGGRDGSTFAIEADGVFIGQCALFNEDHIAHTCELGITIGNKDYWGKSYGRDVVALLVQYAFQYRNYRKVWLRVHGLNVRAQAAYRACGFVEEGRLKAHVFSNGTYDDLVHMSIFRDDWQQAKT